MKLISHINGTISVYVDAEQYIVLIQKTAPCGRFLHSDTTLVDNKPYIVICTLYSANVSKTTRHMEKPQETRNARFKRIAERRTQRVLDDLRLLGNCSNGGNYDYSDDQVNKIFREVEEQLRVTRARFKRRKRNHFKLG